MEIEDRRHLKFSTALSFSFLFFLFHVASLRRGILRVIYLARSRRNLSEQNRAGYVSTVLRLIASVRASLDGALLVQIQTFQTLLFPFSILQHVKQFIPPCHSLTTLTRERFPRLHNKQNILYNAGSILTILFRGTCTGASGGQYQSFHGGGVVPEMICTSAM